MPLVLARSVLNTLADGLRRLASDRTNYNVRETGDRWNGSTENSVMTADIYNAFSLHAVSLF